MKAINAIWEGCCPCYVIAEVGMAHDGSLGLAHAYVDAVARTGACAIKFQTHIAEAESTLDEPFRVEGVFMQDATRYDYWQRTKFTGEQWSGLARHAGEVGLTFLSSAFSLESVDLLDRLEVPAWKVASGELSNIPLLEHMAGTGKPVLLSTGMSGYEDVDRAVDVLLANAARFAVFQCTTAYPCLPERIGLNVLSDLRRRYDCPVGLSDHSGTIFPGLAAATLGAELLEVHVVMSRDMFGPDVRASIKLDELSELVRGVRWVHEMLINPIDKDQVAQEMGSLRATFNKSIVAAHNLSAGTVLEPQHIAFRKPGTGLKTAMFPEIIGRKLKRNLSQNEQVLLKDLC